MAGKFSQEADLLSHVAELNSGFSRISKKDVLPEQIILALEQFTECVRYLNTRRSEGAKLKLESEADIQDALYLMLRPWITDMVYETPTEKSGNRYAIKDFLAKSARTIIEAKFIRDESHGKQISKELHDDIEMYRKHPECDHLVFFIYDPNSLIPDVTALESEISTHRTYDGKAFFCHLIVKP